MRDGNSGCGVVVVCVCFVCLVSVYVGVCPRIRL